MRKKYFSILLIIILYILFITFTFIMYHKINLYILCIGLPYAVLCLVLSLLMHELAHALAASLLGLKVYSIYSLPFTFAKNDSRWHIKEFSFSDGRILGQVLFKLTEIKSNKEYKDIVFKVVITNIVGPLTSLILALIFVGLSLNNNIFIPYTSLPFLISSYVGINSLVLGDGKSAYLFINNNEFALNTIFAIYLYNNNLSKYDNEFLLDMMINNLEENYLRNSISTTSSNNMCIYYLLVQYYLVHDVMKLPEIVKKFIDDIIVQKENLITNNQLKTLIIPFFHLIIIYLIAIRERKNARMIFDFLIENVNHTSIFYKYLKLRSEYYLDYKIELDYLMDQKEEICNYFFYNMEGFYALEENIILLKTQFM